VSDGLALPGQGDLAEGAPAAPAEAKGGRAFVLKAFWELLHDLAVAVLFCFFLVTFVGQAFRVQGSSMRPLLEDKERILVNKLVYRFRPIARGDVVVFWFPDDPQVSFIKRVIGLPGEVVELRRGALYVNGRRVEERYHDPRLGDESSSGPTTVKKGFYYVLGDNRDGSNDSRIWGEVPEKYIYGRAEARFWPPAKIGVIR
jgi:signal peptidase I